MRRIVDESPELTPVFIAHEHAAEFAMISNFLDENTEILTLVHADLARGVSAENGRPGLTAEQTLRALIIKQMNGFSYLELAFHLADSRTYRSFCRLPVFSDKAPSDTALQYGISRFRPETLEAISRIVVGKAKDEGIEDGRKVRIDCTVTETNIHKPDDAAQLWDSVRVLTRLTGRAQALAPTVRFTDHTKRAKRRRLGILNAKGAEQRLPPYRDLLKVTTKTISAARQAAEALVSVAGPGGLAAIGLEFQIRHFIGLALRVVDQTERRVLRGETVPAQEKVVSIFEPHTDIIVKKKRETEFGHKLCLTTGASSLVLDCVVEDGNPADSTLAVSMVERQRDLYGKVPRQVAFDGGFASKANLDAIKATNVKDVMFSKSRGLAITEMVKSAWVYKRLWKFRAGVEGCISFLKRCFGLGRCTWVGLNGFKSYVWGSILSANLLILARHRLE